MASEEGGLPGLIPLSQDSVPNTMSGLMYCKAACSSELFLPPRLLQFTFMKRRFLLSETQ
ncbi:hypothetical protein DPMN_033539 [Dreissena polymorpha]|uniref:Uncharacterized protein n=1 Tax=Dreissena polymorpha TaxID=45954 RepID=A0A9D4M773_DREPO|nr:hypothetical protein DPMN_033539 [Dreissena polymorpha]